MYKYCIFNRLKLKQNLILLFLFFILSSFHNAFAASASCYVLIEGKAGCSGLTNINDVKYTSQLKCFKIDKNAKDCGMFINVLPSDADQNLTTDLEAIDCTGANKNTQECADYCFGNTDALPSECVDCDSLTAAEKVNYSYCQEDEDAKYCQAISNDGNGASWPETLGGISNVAGTCLEGYTGSPIRACSTEGIWEDPSALCTLSTCSIASASSYAPSNLSTWISGSSGSFSVSSTSTVNYGETLTASACNTNYTYSGTTQIKCDGNNTWSVVGTSTGACTAKCTWTDLSNLKYTSYGLTFYLLINTAYWFDGDGNAVSRPNSGTQYYDDGLTYQVACPTSGYTEITKKKIRCNNGTWDVVTEDYCQVHTCTVSNATIQSGIEHISPSSAWALCNDVSTCASTSVIYPSDSATELKYNYRVKFNACDTGYSLSGSMVLKCSDVETWTVIIGGDGACVAQCTWSDLSALTYSSSGLTSTPLVNTDNWYDGEGNTVAKPTSATTYYNSGTTYQVSCPNGYNETTKKEITCNAGTWNTTIEDVCSSL